MKEVGRKSWKKVYMFLRRSGLYCSTKGTSKVTAARSIHLRRKIQSTLNVISLKETPCYWRPSCTRLCLFVCLRAVSSLMFWFINFCLQEPRHLQLLADLEDSNIFTVITGKKQHGAPTDYGFCIKVRDTSEMKQILSNYEILEWWNITSWVWFISCSASCLGRTGLSVQ